MTMTREHRSLPRGLYVITDSELMPDEAFIERAQAALEGGARVLQYRDKSGNDGRRQLQAANLRVLCSRYRVPLIINDDIDLALAVGADGVHIGSDDGDVAETRQRLGPYGLLGVSCYGDIERARAARDAGASYVAFGSFFPSPTKPLANVVPAQLMTQARELGLPCVAIGGITVDNAATLLAAGADALAVISGVFAANDITVAARRFTDLFTRFDGNL